MEVVDTRDLEKISFKIFVKVKFYLYICVLKNNKIDAKTREMCFNINDGTDYLMFMIHSSELMPGGSPNFTDSESIENLFKSITELFDYIKPNVEGCSVSDYATKIKKNDLFKFSAAHT